MHILSSTLEDSERVMSSYGLLTVSMFGKHVSPAQGCMQLCQGAGHASCGSLCYCSERLAVGCIQLQTSLEVMYQHMVGLLPTGGRKFRHFAVMSPSLQCTVVDVLHGTGS